LKFESSTVARLLAAGSDPADAVLTGQIVQASVDAFHRATGGWPRWGWFVPGRIEVFGKHTDYAGGRSLLAAVPRGFAVVAGPRSDDHVRVVDARWGDEVEVPLADHARRFTGWTNYVAVVARRLAHNFPGAELGTDIALSSNLPRASGLSSSSAMVVAVATALSRRAGLETRAEWRLALATTVDLAGYLGAVENGLGFKQLSSLDGVGTHGGSEDHTAILTCRANMLSTYAYVPVRHLGDTPMPAAWRFVVAASGVQADKAGSARDRYNRASLATRAIVDLWNAHTGSSAPTLASLLAGGPDRATELGRVLATAAHPDFSAGELARRLAHFIAEDGRVPLAAAAFRDADAAGLGALSRASQEDADALLGNQIAETRALAHLARERGALAASSFGAGFGGSVWALAPAAEVEAFAEEWIAAYRAACPAIARVEWFVTRPAPGVTDLGPLSPAS
jgi:galactokinase